MDAMMHFRDAPALPEPAEQSPRWRRLLTAAQSNAALAPLRYPRDLRGPVADLVHMTRCAIHAADADDREDAIGWTIDIITAARRFLKAAAPYPEFCTMPEDCAGKSNCQRAMCCAD